MKFIVYLLTLFMVGTAVAQNPTILQGNYITNVFGQSNFVLNPNARTDVLNVTNATRSTTTPLVATSEFTLSLTSGTNATWTLRAFDQGMKGQNCEARFSYRGFATATTKAELVQNSLVVASLTLTPSTDPRIASINFPCGDLTNLTTFRIAQTTANMTGTNEIGGIYVGLATNQANVAQAELVGTWRMVGAAGCQMQTATTTFDQINANANCNTPSVTGSVLATQGKRPWIDINNPKPGNYYVIAKGSFYNTATSLNQYVRLTAVKSSGNESSSQLRIFASASATIVPVTFSISTNFTSGTLGFSIDGATDNTATPVSLVNDNNKQDVTFEVYRFPTSSELVVTPERQNTWGGVVYTNQNQTLFAGTAEPTAFTPYNNATWNQPTLLRGRAQVTTTNSGNDLGFSIPNLPVGQYKLEISGLLNASDNGVNGTYSSCNFKIVETTTSTDVAKQAHETKVSAFTFSTRDFTNSFSGVFNNTSIATRNFRLEANKQADTDAGNLGGCQAYSNTGTTSALNTNITFLLTPLDQPSNSALYVQGPVLGAQTGATIGASYVGEVLTNEDSGDVNATTGTYRTISLNVTPGVWEVQSTCLWKKNGATMTSQLLNTSVTNANVNPSEIIIGSFDWGSAGIASSTLLSPITRVRWDGATNVTEGSSNTSSATIYSRCYPGAWSAGQVLVRQRIKAVRIN